MDEKNEDYSMQQNRNVSIPNRSFESVVKFEYMGEIITGKIFSYDESKCIFNSPSVTQRKN
jgi:hypothetical protein